MAAPELDLETALAMTPATGAQDQKRNSRWLSTSTADSDLELNNFWVSTQSGQALRGRAIMLTILDSTIPYDLFLDCLLLFWEGGGR